MLIFNCIGYFNDGHLKTDELYAEHVDGTIAVAPGAMRGATRADRPAVTKLLESLNDADFVRFLFWAHREIFSTDGDNIEKIKIMHGDALDDVSLADVRARTCQELIASRSMYSNKPSERAVMQGYPDANGVLHFPLSSAAAYVQTLDGKVRAFATPFGLVGHDSDLLTIYSRFIRPSGKDVCLNKLDFVCDFDAAENAIEWRDRVRSALDEDWRADNARKLELLKEEKRRDAAKHFAEGHRLTAHEQHILRVLLGIDTEEVEA